MILVVLGMLLVSPLVLAQEQAQTYSGFGRFADNVKMFFSFGDNKVMLALEIREKEVNSAIVNTKNGEDEEAEKNLEQAKKRLQFVQNKVSESIAKDVKINVDETINKINEEGNLLDNFDVYILEEEKTGLTAELVIEFEGGIQGQIQEQTRTREIETRMNEIDEEIADIVVEDNVVESGIDIDVDKIDPDATPKTPAGDFDDGLCKEGEEDCNDDGVITEGVPEECASQGVYDIEGCNRIMEMVEICCRKTIDGEVKYEWVPGKICVSPYGDRVDEDFCLG